MWIKKLCLAFGGMICAGVMLAQELDCQVTVNHSQIQGTNVQVFKTLEKSLSDFINTRHWTQAQYASNERIRCSMNFIIKEYNEVDSRWTCELVVQSTRPVWQSSYQTVVFSFKDTDVSFNSIRCMDNRYDLTHNLENIVYNELIYMGYKVNVFNKNGREIDFLAQKENKKYYIQVAYSIAEEKTYNREFSAFANIDNLSQKIIITNDDIDYSTSVIKHIKLKEFLIMNSLDDINN